MDERRTDQTPSSFFVQQAEARARSQSPKPEHTSASLPPMRATPSLLPPQALRDRELRLRGNDDPTAAQVLDEMNTMEEEATEAHKAYEKEMKRVKRARAKRRKEKAEL